MINELDARTRMQIAHVEHYLATIPTKETIKEVIDSIDNYKKVIIEEYLSNNK